MLLFLLSDVVMIIKVELIKGDDDDDDELLEVGDNDGDDDDDDDELLNVGDNEDDDDVVIVDDSKVGLIEEKVV